MNRARLETAIADLRKLHETWTSINVADRVKAQTAFLTRISEDPELFPGILDAAAGNLERMESASDSRERCREAVEMQPHKLPIALSQRLKNGENPIKIYRQYRRMTQKDLAASMGVSQPLVGRLEAGDAPDCKLSTLRRVAESLDVDCADLIPRYLRQR